MGTWFQTPITQLLLIIGLLASPVLAFNALYSKLEGGVPTEPDLNGLLDWKPLPDRTVILEFNGISFRHSILQQKIEQGCKAIEVQEDGTIKLLTHIGNNAYEYLIAPKPDFFKVGSGDWKWIGKNTGEKFRGR